MTCNACHKKPSLPGYAMCATCMACIENQWPCKDCLIDDCPERKEQRSV